VLRFLPQGFVLSPGSAEPPLYSASSPFPTAASVVAVLPADANRHNSTGKERVV